MRSHPPPRALLAGALATFASLAPGVAAADVLLGPAVEPFGPGRVGIAWQDTATEPQQVTLRAVGRPDRVIQAQTGESVQRIVLDQLEPGVEYTYVVEGEERGRFIAPPGAHDSVRIAVFGDTRSGHDVHAQLVRDVAAQRPDVCLTTGDDVEDGTSADQWRTFFDLERPLMSVAAFSGVRGNHDVGGMHEKLFRIDSSSPDSHATYGSIDLGPVHVLLVDTETPVTPGTAQYVALEADLAAHQSQPLIALMHRAMYSSGYHGGASNQEVTDALEPLFARYGVDIVFQGHDHHYERTRPIHGVTYVVTGGGGAPLYWVGHSDWTAVAESVHHYLLLDATADRLRVRARRSDGSELDAFDVDPRANNGMYTGLDPTPSGGSRGCAVGVASAGAHGNSGWAGAAPWVALAGVALARRGRRRAT